MTRKSFTSSVLVRVLLDIVLGIACGQFFPNAVTRVFPTFNGLISAFRGFLIPLLIVGLVTPAIGDLGWGAGKWLGVTAVMAYAPTIFSGTLAFYVARGSHLWLLRVESGVVALASPEEFALTGFFSFEMELVSSAS